MPRKKFYFPVSQSINDDPQVWELTDRFGVAGLRVLLEYYKILHLTENHFDDTDEQWKAIGRKLRIYSKTLQKCREFISNMGWIRESFSPKDGIKLHCGSPNYWKYHNMKEPEGIQWRPSVSVSVSVSDSSYKNSKSYPDPTSSAPSADLILNKEKRRKKKMPIDSRIKEISDRIYNSDKEKFKSLIKWINQALKYHYPVEVIVEALKAFEPYKALTEWWPYLDKICYEKAKDFNMAASYLEHQEHKEEIRETAKVLQFPNVGKVRDA